MIIAFTGPSKGLSHGTEVTIAGHMDYITSELDTWRSGCAHGVDTMAAHQAVMTGVLGVELYVPAAPHNEQLVDELDDIATIIQCPNGKEPYRIRNEWMLEGANVLVAFVWKDTFYRSGEWMTINIARKAGIQVDMNVI